MAKLKKMITRIDGKIKISNSKISELKSNIDAIKNNNNKSLEKCEEIELNRGLDKKQMEFIQQNNQLNYKFKSIK